MHIRKVLSPLPRLSRSNMFASWTTAFGIFVVSGGDFHEVVDMLKAQKFKHVTKFFVIFDQVLVLRV